MKSKTSTDKFENWFKERTYSTIKFTESGGLKTEAEILMPMETTPVKAVAHCFNTSVAIPNVAVLFRRPGNVEPAANSRALNATK